MGATCSGHGGPGRAPYGDSVHRAGGPDATYRHTSDGSLDLACSLILRMDCKHLGFHSITSKYDREAGTLVYVETCDRCGVRLKEVYRLLYRPEFEPRGRRAGSCQMRPS
jgi:hypothetical protein